MSQSIPVREDRSINVLFEGAADAVEEVIYNAVCMAEKIPGLGGRMVEALGLQNLKEVMEKYL